MGKLIRLAPMVLAFLASSAAADRLERWSIMIGEAGARFGLPEEWIRAVMRAESGGTAELAGRPIVSPAGAMGLMQLMPGTWRDMRAALALGTDPYNPRDNILAGAAYLRLMYDRFGYPGLFAAYNAGPARYQSVLTRRKALPVETEIYVRRITRLNRVERQSSDALLMIGPESSAASAAAPNRNGLFVQFSSDDHH